MDESAIRNVLDDLFGRELLDASPGEWGIADHCASPSALGFCTTITPETIRTAIDKRVDVVVTHHDAWDFMYEQREDVHALLREEALCHIWAHRPLDAADFGPAAALLAGIGAAPTATMDSIAGSIGDLPEATCYAEVRNSISAFLGEQPRAESVPRREAIGRIAFVPGAGIYTGYMKEMLPHGIDLYITGETNMYLMEYARYHGVGVLIYTHNYTELPGVQAFAKRIARSLHLDVLGHLGDSHF